MIQPAVPVDSGTDWTAQIEHLEDEARLAFLARDIGRLEALWSEELAVNSPIGRVLDRPRVFELLQRGVIAHSSFELHVESVTRHENIVVVMGYDVVTEAPDSPAVRRRFTNVWQASGTSWRMVARHANVAAPQAVP